MRILATLNEVGAVNGKKVTDSKTGEQKEMKFVNVTFSEGKDTFAAEAKYENADALVKQQAANDMRGRLCWFELNVSVSEYTDKDGFERKRSQPTLLSVKPCW